MRKWLWLLLVIGGVLAIDQITKRVVIENVALGQTVRLIPALSPFFQITRSQNTGAAFGVLPQGGDVFLVIAIVVVAAMVYFYPRIPAEARLTQFATGLICGGALGNALDRLQYGHVVDFIHYQIPGLISNVSNLADHALVLGVIILFVDSWRQ
ncbi:MAG: signal peptidase II [Chloroflexi bacterium]|nr:signal peptidase II [Chloroflexota bacterium]